jgi:hypothetical protein
MSFQSLKTKELREQIHNIIKARFARGQKPGLRFTPFSDVENGSVFIAPPDSTSLWRNQVNNDHEDCILRDRSWVCNTLIDDDWRTYLELPDGHSLRLDGDNAPILIHDLGNDFEDNVASEYDDEADCRSSEDLDDDVSVDDECDEFWVVVVEGIEISQIKDLMLGEISAAKNEDASTPARRPAPKAPSYDDSPVQIVQVDVSALG